ncbi:MAG TPA: choice-of-anchor tandem repeat GloVer-containing protein [Terriglobales bacterium]
MTGQRSKIVLITAALLAWGLATPPSASAADSYKVLHWFHPKEGVNPEASMIWDASGNLYGTAYNGGDAGAGTVFQLISDGNGHWTENVLYSFCSVRGCPDGEYPAGGLVFDTTGRLYGSTLYGGYKGQGTVFQLTPGANGTWTYKVLYNFCKTDCADGALPSGTLTFGPDGDLYGTTLDGGIYWGGTVFRLKPTASGPWRERVLYSFCAVANCSDGLLPTGNLVFDSSGNLYGVTMQGGGPNGNCFGNHESCGTVFQLTPGDGGNWTEQVIHHFTYEDGDSPRAGVIFDGLGNLYGTAPIGGKWGGGVVFELSPGADGAWTETTLHEFYDLRSNPQGSLTFDTAGNLYGTLASGGPDYNGTVFRLSPSQGGGWTQTVLHLFNGKDGAAPTSGLIFDQAGNLYGVATAGGIDNYGVVFELTP